MTATECGVGVGVSEDHLDGHVRPAATARRFANTDAGLRRRRFPGRFDRRAGRRGGTVSARPSRSANPPTSTAHAAATAAIARDDLDKLAESKKSLMPEGFEKTMTKDELTNLLEFLTQKGKFVPIPLDKYATVVTTKGMFFEDDGDLERLIFKDWTPKTFAGVPFALTDPQGDKIKNAILLYGPNGKKPPAMPKSVVLPCNTKAKALHFLSGVGGWNFPSTPRGSLTMTVVLTYADGKTESHEWKNGVHFADYIRKIEVPESKYAFALRGQQIRYLSVVPKRPGEVVKSIELKKGTDESAPVVMAVTIETE